MCCRLARAYLVWSKLLFIWCVVSLYWDAYRLVLISCIVRHDLSWPRHPLVGTTAGPRRATDDVLTCTVLESEGPLLPSEKAWLLIGARVSRARLDPCICTCATYHLNLADRLGEFFSATFLPVGYRLLVRRCPHHRDWSTCASPGSSDRSYRPIGLCHTPSSLAAASRSSKCLGESSARQPLLKSRDASSTRRAPGRAYSARHVPSTYAGCLAPRLTSRPQLTSSSGLRCRPSANCCKKVRVRVCSLAQPPSAPPRLDDGPHLARPCWAVVRNARSLCIHARALRVICFLPRRPSVSLHWHRITSSFRPLMYAHSMFPFSALARLCAYVRSFVP